MPKAKKTVSDATDVPAEIPAVPAEVTAEIPSTIDGPGVKCDRAPHGSRAYTMLRALAAQPKTRFIIPLDKGEKKGSAFAPVVMNGLRINILKGVFVELPVQVAEHLQESYYATEDAVNNAKTVNPLTGKTENANLASKTDDERGALDA